MGRFGDGSGGEGEDEKKYFGTAELYLIRFFPKYVRETQIHICSFLPAVYIEYIIIEPAIFRPSIRDDDSASSSVTSPNLDAFSFGDSSNTL